MTIITQGQFTSTGVGVSIPLPSSADAFRTVNITQMGTTQATGRVVEAEWFGNNVFPDNDGLRHKKADNTSVISIDHFSDSTASNGFTYITECPRTEAQAANAITAITAADPAVVSQVNSYSEGDVIRIYNTTGMRQIGGMVFQISSVTSTDYELIGLDASGFAAAATAGFTRRLSKFEAVLPQYLYVTSISQASQAVVRTSVDPSSYYSVGMLITFSVPQSFGMSEIDRMTGKIVSINAATYEMVVNIDTQNFTAFAFPADTEVPTVALFATIAPAGARTREDYVTGEQTGYDFAMQAFRTAEYCPHMFLAAGAQSPAGSDGDIIVWQALKSEIGIISANNP